jgi:subtilisin-like proprotein convertase family protein
VPNIAYLDLQLSQDSANPVAIRLVNPSGSITTVVETDAALVVLDLEPVKVAGDESAGGRWQLEIEDIGGNASGAVSHVALTLDTRWD